MGTTLWQEIVFTCSIFALSCSSISLMTSLESLSPQRMVPHYSAHTQHLSTCSTNKMKITITPFYRVFCYSLVRVYRPIKKTTTTTVYLYNNIQPALTWTGVVFRLILCLLPEVRHPDQSNHTYHCSRTAPSSFMDLVPVFHAQACGPHLLSLLLKGIFL